VYCEIPRIDNVLETCRHVPGEYGVQASISRSDQSVKNRMENDGRSGCSAPLIVYTEATPVTGPENVQRVWGKRDLLLWLG
jgi:hypothetical protein